MKGTSPLGCIKANYYLQPTKPDSQHYHALSGQCEIGIAVIY